MCKKLPKKGQDVLQNCAKMKPKTCQNGPQMGPRRWPGGPKSEEKTSSQQKGREQPQIPHFWPKKSPTWPQLGPLDGAKIAQKSIQKSIKKSMHLGIDFWKDFGGFGDAKWSQVGTNIVSKIILNFERQFFEKTSFFFGKK